LSKTQQESLDIQAALEFKTRTAEDQTLEIARLNHDLSLKNGVQATLDTEKAKIDDALREQTHKNTELEAQLSKAQQEGSDVQVELHTKSCASDEGAQTDIQMDASGAAAETHDNNGDEDYSADTEEDPNVMDVDEDSRPKKLSPKARGKRRQRSHEPGTDRSLLRHGFVLPDGSLLPQTLFSKVGASATSPSLQDDELQPPAAPEPQPILSPFAFQSPNSLKYKIRIPAKPKAERPLLKNPRLQPLAVHVDLVLASDLHPPFLQYLQW
ncbi:hypothetical protein DXG01_012267, partial [Tephrocybe rancida]